MSLFGLFDVGKTALMASQTALAVTGNNIANVNTPGYTRQEVILDIATPVPGPGGQIGRGVRIAGIRRSYDYFIQSQILGQRRNYGRSLALDQTLGMVEQVFNDPIGVGLSSGISEFLNAWHDVATNPEGLPQRNTLLQKAGILAAAAGRMERTLLDTLSRINTEVRDIAGGINDMASRIAILNERIVQIEAGIGSGKASDLRDIRDRLLNNLSELTDFSALEDADGAVTVSVGMRNLVSGAHTNTISVTVNQDGGAGLLLDGVDITSSIVGGRLAGLIASQRDVESTFLTGLRRLAASIVKQVNLLHSTGYGLDGSSGNDFFSPLQASTNDYSSGADITASISDLSLLTLDEYNITFDAGGNYYVATGQGVVVASGMYASGSPVTVNGITMIITGPVSAEDSFKVSPLKTAVQSLRAAVTDPRSIAAASSAAGLPGDNLVALQIAALSDTTTAELDSGTFSDFYAGLASGIGSLKSAAADSLRFDENLLSELESRRESVSGVSLDEEAANLILYQRSFEAGARMIKVADELLQTVLNI